MENTISIKKLAKDSFEIGRRNYIPMLLNSFFYATTLFLLSQSYFGRILIPALLSGLLLFSLKCARGEKLDTPDSVLDGFKKNRWWKIALFPIFWIVIPLIALLFTGFIFYLIISTIKGGAVGNFGDDIESYITGFLFGALGIYFAVHLIHGFYFLVEEPHDSINAFKKSWDLVKRVGWWKTFACLFVLHLFITIINGFVDKELSNIFNFEWRYTPVWYKILIQIINLLIAPFVISYLPLLYLRSKLPSNQKPNVSP
jgi:hypothetical protein